MANARNPSKKGMGASKRVQLFPKQLVGFNVESNMSDSIKKLEAAVREKILRSATRAAVLVMYNEMRLRVPVNTGTLYGSIYHYHDDKRSTKFRQVYVTGPNKVKASHWYNVEYGHWRYNMFLNGRWQRSKSNRNARGPGAHDLPGALKVPVWTPASPYIRPTWEAKVGQLSRAFNQRARERFAEIVNGSAATGDGE